MADTLETNETHRLIASDKVEGTKVYNPEGEKLGTVANVMIDKRSGKSEYAVLEFGGLFGLGSDHYPLPWDMLTYDIDQGGYVVDVAKDRHQCQSNSPYSFAPRPRARAGVSHVT